MTQLDKTQLQTPFTLGVATSAYQIEGAYKQDGRGLSIWDTFSHTPGKIKDGSNGDVACDHYNRMPEDVALMEWLGVTGYRFSISWPRVLPEGTGAINEKGLDFYERLVDALLEKGITPHPTLYHWDLPAALNDRGGWLNRDVTDWFAAYAQIVVERLGDRVPMWFTHNEPWCQAFLGYEHGIFAPGHTNFKEALTCAHHLLLSHGKAVQAVRTVADIQIGPALNFSPAYPFLDTSENHAAARRQNGYFNKWFADPIAGLGYPQYMVECYGAHMPPFPPTDMDIISTPIDMMGVNYYERTLVRASNNGILKLSHTERPGTHTLDREIYFDGIGDVLRNLYYNYNFTNLVVTENGAAFHDQPDANNYVDDQPRVEFLQGHLQQITALRKEGVPVSAYFAWSLMDNFEWNLGYPVTYGICHVDRHTLKRTPKASAHFLRSLRAGS